LPIALFTMNKLPVHYRKYFWDCDFHEITMEKYQFFITERLLNYGNEQTLKWLLSKITKIDLRNVVNKSRNLDKKTKNYWQTILNEREIIKKHLAELGEMELFSEDKDTINAGINGIRVSFFIYEISMMNDLIEYKNISIASLLDIALMKLAAISGRGSKKDFIDLYFLLTYFDLPDLLKKFSMKFGKESTNIYHLLKSLVYFDDAEEQPSPVMIKRISWPEVKQHIVDKVKYYPDKKS